MPTIHDQLFISGEWTPARSGLTFEAIDPSTEEVLAGIARGDARDIDDAVRAARQAFGHWRRVTPTERGRLLYGVARALEARADEFAELETLDTGNRSSMPW